MNMIQRSVSVLLFSLFILLPFEISAQEPYYGKSYALVIGINKYPSSNWPDLDYAVKDAEGVEAFLRNQGFEIIPLYNKQATKEEIISKMQNYLARIVQSDDRVLIFFSGHGYTENLGGQDWGYIVPYDAKSSSVSYISMEELRTQSQKMNNAKHQLFIMDACYSGLLGSKGGGVDPNIPNYIKEVTRRPARQIITAGGKDEQVADGGPKGYSLFTGCLLEALEEGLADSDSDGYITFKELSSYLIPRASNPLSTPTALSLNGHGMGEFVFKSPRGVIEKYRDQFVPGPDNRKGPDVTGAEQQFRTVDELGFKFVRIKPEAFKMGFDFGDEDERPAHRVLLTRPFYISKYEVTQQQWMQVMGNNPSRFKNGKNPVDTVSWNDAQEFIKKLNEIETSVTYRLPTEAEWEYVASSGLEFDRTRQSLRDLAWVRSNSKKQSHLVGSKPPNKYGIYDMYGNVWEWVNDYFSPYHDHFETDPHGADAGKYRVSRGGSWVQDSAYARPSFRNYGDPGERHDDVGFRIVLDIND